MKHASGTFAACTTLISARAACIAILLAAFAAAIGARPRQAGEAGAPPAPRLHPEVARIAADTAKKVAKSGLHQILLTPLAGCLEAPQLCAEFDAALHADLASSISGAQFIPRENALKFLTEQRFLAIDAYLGALDDVAAFAGAEVVVGEKFSSAHNACQLRTTIVDAKRHYSLGETSTRIPCSDVPGKTKLSTVRDDQAGVSLIVTVPQSLDTAPDAAPIHHPDCLRCPDPHFSAYARERQIQGSVIILMTITEEGRAKDPRVVGAVEESLARVSVEAVSEWQFIPATGSDGKPFPVRVPVEVTFRLAP